MFKKFSSGLAFGAGFTLAALAIYSVWLFVLLPKLIIPAIPPEGVMTEPMKRISPSKVAEVSQPFINHFDELTVDEKIKASSVIMVVNFERNENGSYKSTVEEILKKEKGTELYYDVGDTYEEPVSYPFSGDKPIKKAIVFMQGSLARMRYSTTFSGDRIISLGGITLDAVRNKCKEMQ